MTYPPSYPSPDPTGLPGEPYPPPQQGYPQQPGHPPQQGRPAQPGPPPQQSRPAQPGPPPGRPGQPVGTGNVLRYWLTGPLQPAAPRPAIVKALAASAAFAAVIFGLVVVGTAGWSIYKIAIFSLICGLPLVLLCLFLAVLAAATARGMLMGEDEAFQRGIALSRLVAFIPALVVFRGTFEAFDEGDPAKIITVLIALVIVVISIGPSLLAKKSPHDEAIATYVRETARLRGH